jgi:multidrug efflux pump subunit AcrB
MTLKRLSLLLLILVPLTIAGISIFLVRPWLATLLDRRAELPVIFVEASYPGANAQVVADTVAAPIEQQVNGVEQMVYMRSQSRNDGSYTLQVTFEAGTDLNVAQVLVQNRTSLAEPILPDRVKQLGVTIKKKSPHALMCVALSSPENRFDPLYLGNYANIQLKGELARVAGVGDIVLAGHQDYGLRLFLELDKIAARGLTTKDVLTALQETQPALGQQIAPGGRVLTLTTSPWRPVNLEEIAATVISSGTDGQHVRLRDVVQIEMGGETRSHARLDGHAVVVLAIYPLPGANRRELNAAVQDRLAMLRENLPQGVALDVPFNATAKEAGRSEYLRVDLTLPDNFSSDQTRKTLERCDAAAREVPGVLHVLALRGLPFAAAENDACLLIRLAPADGEPAEITQAIRAKLEKDVIDATVRICDLSASPGFGTGDYPIDLLVYGPEDDQVRKLADGLGARLRQSEQLTDLRVAAGMQDQLSLVIDLARAKALGVSMADIQTVLQTHFGSVEIDDFNRFGRSWRVTVHNRASKASDDLEALKIRNNEGNMVALPNLITVRREKGPAVVDRFNLYPVVQITANPAAGVSVANVRAMCEAEAEAARKELSLPRVYRWTWAQGVK